MRLIITAIVASVFSFAGTSKAESTRDEFVDRCIEHLTSERVVRPHHVMQIVQEHSMREGNSLTMDDIPKHVWHHFGSATCENDGGDGSERSDAICGENKAFPYESEIPSLSIINSNGDGKGEYDVIPHFCRGIASVLKHADLLPNRNLERTNAIFDDNFNDVFSASSKCKCVNPLGIDFGTTCDSWDFDLNRKCLKQHEMKMSFRTVKGCIDEAKENGLDEWCCSRWCFIDPDHCERPYSKKTFSDKEWDFVGSPLFTNASEYSATSYHVSYETCGNVKSYNPEELYERLSAVELKVGYPGDSSDGYTLVTIDDKKVGSVADFVHDFEQQFNITFVRKSITKASRDRYPNSSYTACVHDIGLGELDLCVGAFWLTTERSLMTSFTNSMYRDEFYLIVGYGDDVSIAESFVTPFLPFELSAWVAIIFLVMYMSFVIRIIQVANKFEEEEGDLRRYENYKHPFIRYFGYAIFDGMTSFTKGEVTHIDEDDTSIPEKIVVMGFAVFALIVLTAYTATSAAFMASSNIKADYSSFEEVIEAGENVCVPSAVYDQFFNLYSTESRNLEGRLIQCSNGLDCFEKQDNGICSATLLDLDGFKRILSMKDGLHCDKMKTGNVLMALGNGLPITRKYRRDINYIVDEEVSRGNYETQKRLAQDKYLESLNCNIDGSSVLGEEPIMELPQMAAPLLITGACTTAGLIIFLLKSRRLHRLERWRPSAITSVYNDVSKKFADFEVDRDPLTGEKGSDRALKCYYQNMDLSSLLSCVEEECKGYGRIDETLVSSAIDKLPDRSHLVALLYSIKCSKSGKQRLLLDKLDFAALLSIARQSKFFDVDDLHASSSNQADMKDNLIDHILEEANLLHQAFMLAKENDRIGTISNGYQITDDTDYSYAPSEK